MRFSISWMSNLLAAWRSGYVDYNISPRLPQIVSSIPHLRKNAPADTWRIQQVNRSLSDMDVLTIGSPISSYSVVLYLPRSARAVQGFERQKTICAGLQADTRLNEWQKLLPRLIYEGRFRNKPYWVVERIPGVSMATVMQDPAKRPTALKTALDTVKYLHKTTVMEVCVNDTLLERLVSVPLQNICKSTLICYHWHSLKLLKRIEMQLLDALRGRQMVVCWIHGDYWPENLLVTPNGDAVTGIVDWDLSQPMSFPSLDLVNMLLSTRQIEEGKELGIILSDVVKQGAWRQPEQVLWEDARRDLGGKFPEIRESLLIFWLQHLSANLKKAWRYSVNPVWAFNTFTRVITSL